MVRRLRYIPTLLLPVVAQAQTVGQIGQKEATPPYTAAGTINSTDGSGKKLSAPVVIATNADGSAISGGGGGGGGGNTTDVTGNGTLALGTANATFALPLSAGRGIVGFAISGLTGSGATLTVEGSNDGGTTWTNANTTESNATSSLSATLTANGQPRVSAAGRTNLRLRVSTAGTGTATIAYTATTATGLVALISGLPTGGNFIGYSQSLDSFVTPAPIAATANTAYVVNLTKGQGTVAFAITGLTASGATLTAQYSDDNGANYYPLRNIGTATVPGTTTFTTDGPISFTGAGHTQLRLIVTTAGTGNITIGSNASAPARGVNLEGAGTAATNPFYTAAQGVPAVTAPGYVDGIGGRSADGLMRPLLTSTLGVLAAPTAGVAQSTGTVTSVAANTSTTVCPAATNPVVYEVQIYGTAGVLLGLDGQALTATTPAAGSGAYMYLPTQYTLYTGPVARTNAITAYTGTAMTITCNIVTRQ